MAIPVSVVLDRTPYGTGPLDLTQLVAEDSLEWSSVVPGGFGSCTFKLDGDFRNLTKQVPYLSILRVVGDSGRILFEGQIEDKTPSLSEQGMGMNVGAFGLQNQLKEKSLRNIWSKRDMEWVTPIINPVGTAWAPGYQADANVDAEVGQVDQTDLTKAGVRISGRGTGSTPVGGGNFAEWFFPIGLSVSSILGIVNITPAATAAWSAVWYYLNGGAWSLHTTSTTVGPFAFNLGAIPAGATAYRIGAANRSAGAVTVPAANLITYYAMRFLGVIAEDVSGGFYGDSLIRSIVGFVPGLGQGVIESGSDFSVDHLDASVRRAAYDILQEVAQYYSREWAVWEDALLHWRTPQLSQPQWIVPVTLCETLDLDASVVNSKQQAIVLYTDAATGLPGEQSVSATDRRNPYVLNGRAKDAIVDGGTMTANTALQFATLILQDLGFGPVPASGSISVPGEAVIQHAQGNALKAWEIRAGDNITIPELPLADVFTQDGRGECLFHVVSAEADSSTGMMTFTLDSYGSKRSDVLMARLAAVTSALGG